MAGRFRFGLRRRITLADGSEVDLFSPRDALVLKCLAWLLSERLMDGVCDHPLLFAAVVVPRLKVQNRVAARLGLVLG